MRPQGAAMWPSATHVGRRPPAREVSVPAPQGPRRRAAERLELLVVVIFSFFMHLVLVTYLLSNQHVLETRHILVGFELEQCLLQSLVEPSSTILKTRNLFTVASDLETSETVKITIKS